MKLADALKQAIEKSNARQAGHCADQLRKCGMNYAQIFAFAREQQPGLTLNEWEDLMSEADEGQI